VLGCALDGDGAAAAADSAVTDSGWTSGDASASTAIVAAPQPLIKTKNKAMKNRMVNRFLLMGFASMLIKIISPLSWNNLP
jgi:hypothetical protein